MGLDLQRPLDEANRRAVYDAFIRHHVLCFRKLMWDNRCLLHRANTNFEAARYPRVLQRICLRGMAPA